MAGVLVVGLRRERFNGLGVGVKDYLCGISNRRQRFCSTLVWEFVQLYVGIIEVNCCDKMKLYFNISDY